MSDSTIKPQSVDGAPSVRFHDIQAHVERYVQDSLADHKSLESIVDSFKDNPLPAQLTKGDYTDAELRRHGQLVSTRYLIKNHQNALASIAEDGAGPESSIEIARSRPVKKQSQDEGIGSDAQEAQEAQKAQEVEATEETQKAQEAQEVEATEEAQEAQEAQETETSEVA